MKIQKFLFGQSNPTYLITCGKDRFVLRKKPPGKLLPSAHAIEREYRVMAALESTRVPVPKMYCLCTDSSIIGTPFYVCSFVNGRVYRAPHLPDFKDPSVRFAIYSELNRVLAAIHSVNIHEVGLTRFSRGSSKAKGSDSNYVQRLTRRWTKQYEAARAKETNR